MLDGLLDRENLLLLATRPAEATRRFGDLVASACARGRPPIVAMLTDGTRDDAAAEAEARDALAALAALGLRTEPVLLGVHARTAPRDGPLFALLARGLGLLAWRQDCTLVCASEAATGDAAAAQALATAVARQAGLPLLLAQGSPPRFRLDR